MKNQEFLLLTVTCFCRLPTNNPPRTEGPPTSCLGMTAVKQSQPFATFMFPMLRTGPWCRSVCGENALALHNTADALVYIETSIYGRPSPAYSTGVWFLWKYIGMEELHKAAELCNAIISHLSQYAIALGQKVNDPGPVAQLEQNQVPFNIPCLPAQMHFGLSSNSVSLFSLLFPPRPPA